MKYRHPVRQKDTKKPISTAVTNKRTSVSARQVHTPPQFSYFTPIHSLLHAIPDSISHRPIPHSFAFVVLITLLIPLATPAFPPLPPRATSLSTTHQDLYTSTPTKPVHSKLWSSVTSRTWSIICSKQGIIAQASTSNTPVPPPYSSATPVFVSPSPRHPLPSTMTTREPPLSSPLPPYDHLLGHYHVPPPSKNVDAAPVYVQGHPTIVSHPIPPLNHSPLRTIDSIVAISRRITK
ncbi:hypothetical protein BDN71DRAFT_1514555 [Pleurotus eryngii]|uniref:Uncharacterized protein n=1 Tax=Pleurotus eryngii TaxID=5323 RepID=A0A9P5ZHR0_PLEER|nr:hypothetical protein BDN71DRAFT_1514555 [Pleurotus eryngii]